MLNSSSANLTSITIQWGVVECIDQNSDITGYRIMVDGRTMTRDSSDTQQFIATGLFPNTMYTLQVAAVSENGIGPYSDITASTTQPKGISCSIESSNKIDSY